MLLLLSRSSFSTWACDHLRWGVRGRQALLDQRAAESLQYAGVWAGVWRVGCPKLRWLPSAPAEAKHVSQETHIRIPTFEPIRHLASAEDDGALGSHVGGSSARLCTAQRVSAVARASCCRPTNTR